MNYRFRFLFARRWTKYLIGPCHRVLPFEVRGLVMMTNQLKQEHNRNGSKTDAKDVKISKINANLKKKSFICFHWILHIDLYIFQINCELLQNKRKKNNNNLLSTQANSNLHKLYTLVVSLDSISFSALNFISVYSWVFRRPSFSVCRHHDWSSSNG